jgi:hypothetical protein
MIGLYHRAWYGQLLKKPITCCQAVGIKEIKKFLGIYEKEWG